MHLFSFPDTTRELLKYLRSLPSSDPQYLLDAYTQSLNLIRDDLHSLFIFLDYINLSMNFSETDEIEHLYNLFKVKLRKFKIFWINYIKFEVEKRKKGFDAVFSKVLEYLKVKVFEGKEDLAESLMNERDTLKNQLEVGIDGPSGPSEQNSHQDIDRSGRAEMNCRDSLCTENKEELDREGLSTIEILSSTIFVDQAGLGAIENIPNTDNVGRKNVGLGPGLQNVPVGASNAIELPDFETVDVDSEPHTKKDPCEVNVIDHEAAGENTLNKAAERSAFELELSGSPASQKLRFSPKKRGLYGPGSPRKAARHGVNVVGRRFVEIAPKSGIDGVFSCDLFEKTISFSQGHNTIAFKDKGFICINRIGKGGYSNVYSVFYGGELYALKQIRVEDQESLNICLDEINLLKRLSDCEFVIRMIDYEIKGELVNILLEYGETDLQKLIQSGPMNTFYIKYIWESILKILVFIHANRIVHRDIKPANFVLVRGKVRIIDFGISKSIRGDTTSVLNFEKAGTLNYISPEQCSGRKVSRSSDVWAAGCILYHMIYRKNIHNGKNVMDVLRMMADETEIEYGAADAYAIESMRACLVYDPKKRAKPEELLGFQFLKKT